MLVWNLARVVYWYVPIGAFLGNLFIPGSLLTFVSFLVMRPVVFLPTVTASGNTFKVKHIWHPTEGATSRHVTHVCDNYVNKFRPIWFLLPAKGEIVIEKQELPLHQIRALCAALVFALNILLFNMMKQFVDVVRTPEKHDRVKAKPPKTRLFTVRRQTCWRHKSHWRLSVQGLNRQWHVFCKARNT